MLKIIIMFLMPFSVLSAEGGNVYFYSPSPSCFIKEFKDSKTILVNEKEFEGVPIKAQRLKRNNHFMAFKFLGNVYFSPVECLREKRQEVAALENFENLDDVDISQKFYGEAPPQKEKSPYRASEFKMITQKESYLSIRFGKGSMSSDGLVLNAWEEGRVEQGGSGETIVFDKYDPSTFKVKAAYEIEYGYRNSFNHFWSVKFKWLKASKDESIYGFVNSVPTKFLFQINDTHMSILGGHKFVFRQLHNLRFLLGGYIGVSIIESKVNSQLNLSSFGFSAQLEGGLQYIFNSTFAIDLIGNYEYLGPRRFRMKGKDSGGDIAYSEDSIKTQMNYSNMSALMGLTFYFN